MNIKYLKTKNKVTITMIIGKLNLAAISACFANPMLTIHKVMHQCLILILICEAERGIFNKLSGFINNEIGSPDFA
jgi:hypothetical protein